MALGKTNAITITGGTPVQGVWRVRYFDIDGTILKTEWVANNGNSTPPTANYDSTYLTFNSWNQTYTNITEHKDIGAIYDTLNNHTYVRLFLTSTTGKSPTLYITKSNATDSLTINWGDNINTAYTSASIQANHTYTNYGMYVITISVVGTATFYFGNNTATTAILGDNAHAGSLVDVFNGTKCLSIGTYSLAVNQTANCYAFSSFQALSLNPLTTQFLYYKAFGIKHINIPIAENNFSNINYTFSYMTLKSTMTTINTNFLQNNYFIEYMMFHSGITTIQDNAIVGNSKLEILVFNSTTPPTRAASTSIRGNSPYIKIYVPDASVDTYKSATNWVGDASKIYPLSQLILV